MGLSYTDPQSHLYHPDWQAAKILGSIGGTIMTDRGADVFLSFSSPRFSASELSKATLELIVSEPYHDERVPAVQTFTPWLAGAALLLVIAYAAPIAQTIRSNFPGAPGYSPDNPRPITTTRSP